MEYGGAIGNPVSEQDQWLAETFERESRRLRSFIRKRIPDEVDAEDILQDVFFELVTAYRLMKPVAHTGAWLFQVARNKITDLFRARKPDLVDDGERLFMGDLLPSPALLQDAEQARRMLLEEMEAALDELPPDQREVFIAHEIEGQSFREIAEETGVGVSTLLSRKHYAVKFLRRRLRGTYNEMIGRQK